MTKELPQVVTKSILQAQNLLRASGCSFKIIDPADNEILHDPESKLNPVKRAGRKRMSNAPYGELAAYYRPFVSNVKVGDVVQIPVKGYVAESLRSSLCARLSTEWGKGSYTCSANKKTNTVEVLRIA